MAQVEKAKVFMSGRSQAVRIPAEFRFTAKEVSVRRDPETGDLILSQKPNWEEIFAMFDAAGVPDDFLTERPLEPRKDRGEL